MFFSQRMTQIFSGNSPEPGCGCLILMKATYYRLHSTLFPRHDWYSIFVEDCALIPRAVWWVSVLARRQWEVVWRLSSFLGSAVASCLVRSSPDGVFRVRATAGDIALCSWARHFILTVPLYAQVHEWVPTYLKLEVTLRRTSIPSAGE